MKKAGILSMQRIFNYGSFLQAYGLKSILEDLGCSVEFADYRPGECLVPSNEGTGLMRKVTKVLETFRYSAPLKEKIRFIQYKKNYARNYYPYLGISGEPNYAPELDLLVIGSDEVFNCVQNNTNVGFSPELFGEGNRADRLISYAASFGNTTMEKLAQYNVDEQVGGWLIRFDGLSVRDANSGEIVEAFTGQTPEYHLDPVLAYDYIGRCDAIPKDVPESDYMILYGYSGRFTKEECKEIRRYADSKNLKVYCIGGIQDCCDKFIDCDPFKVIAYFQHAECVVTDTFHGTILSVITNRPFAAFVREQGYGNAEKLKDLLKRLELTDRIMHDLAGLEDKIQSKIEYDRVNEIIRKERARSYEYLKQHIDF